MFLGSHLGSFIGNVAVGQNQWYHFGVGAPPSFVYFRGDWDVHYETLTHGHVSLLECPRPGLDAGH